MYRNPKLAVAYREKMKGTCEECDRKLIWDKGVVHHRVPFAKHGPDTNENLILVCKPCHIRLHGSRLRNGCSWRRTYNWLLKHVYCGRGAKTALAKELGVTTQTLINWDNGRHVPGHEMQAKLKELKGGK